LLPQQVVIDPILPLELPFAFFLSQVPVDVLDLTLRSAFPGQPPRLRLDRRGHGQDEA
jgi:hypothetical protein